MMENSYEPLLNTSFKDATIQYLSAIRLILATFDEGSINDLKILCMINDKMNSYLKAIIEAKKSDKKHGLKFSFKDFYNMIGKEDKKWIKKN